ncbi:hypothetical protein [Flexibacterium corallicola]|uniref:hypothetical protein n=1 Tax=Flexibacterium corallicola TaxID=3037259 RepID=UPI00286ED545|nr:hypothetical protein [Pseudovibrio sp. M1P-2-3]
MVQRAGLFLLLALLGAGSIGFLAAPSFTRTVDCQKLRIFTGDHWRSSSDICRDYGGIKAIIPEPLK